MYQKKEKLEKNRTDEYKERRLYDSVGSVSYPLLVYPDVSSYV